MTSRQGCPAAATCALLDAGDGLWLVASSVPERSTARPRSQRGLQDLDWVGQRAMAHEAVVEHFLRAPAVLPMQLFTLFTSDERAMAHVARDRKRIARILARIERQVEWGLRLTWDEKAVRETRRAARTTGRPSGTAFLARKRDLLDVNRVQLTEARAAGRPALSRDGARGDRRAAPHRDGTGGARLAAAARRRVPRARAQGRRVPRCAAAQHRRRSAARAWSSSLTGPWPPYNFI